MSLEGLTKKILFDAEKTKEAVLERVQKEIKEIETVTENEKEKLKDDAAKKLATVLAENRKRIESAGRLQKKLAIAKAERESLDALFDLAYKRLGELSQKEYKEFIIRSLEKIPHSKEGVIYTSSHEAYKNTLTTVLKELGLSYTVKVDETIFGGFTLHIDNTTYDCTFRTLIELHKPDLEAVLVNKFFSYGSY